MERFAGLNFSCFQTLAVWHLAVLRVPWKFFREYKHLSVIILNNKHFWPRKCNSISTTTSMGLKPPIFSLVNLQSISWLFIHYCWQKQISVQNCLWPLVHIHNNVLYHWSSCEVTLPSTLAVMLSEALFSSWSIVLYSLMYSVYNYSVILWECFDRFTTLLFQYSPWSSCITWVYSAISVYHVMPMFHVICQTMTTLIYANN